MASRDSSLAICHTFSYSCFANVRFPETDLCPKASQVDFLSVALPSSKMPQTQLDQILYKICVVHFTLQKVIQYNATQNDLAFIMII